MECAMAVRLDTAKKPKSARAKGKPARYPVPPAPNVLALSGPDREGLVAAVSQFIADWAGRTAETAQFGDPVSGRVFMRVVFEGPPARGRGGLGSTDPLALMRQKFAELCGQLSPQGGMNWELAPLNRRLKLALVAGPAPHVLDDLLYRQRIKSLPIDIAGLFAPQGRHSGPADWHDIPRHDAAKGAMLGAKGERKLSHMLDRAVADIVVLAPDAPFLSEKFCTRHAGRLLHVHRAFIPEQPRPKPEVKAYKAGVKLIGATVQFLRGLDPERGHADSGAIIEQDVVRVDHRATAEELEEAALGVECAVLARALGWIAERRVFLNGFRTVVFR
jgi:formyltetrahydrofolate deformylase